MTDIGIRFGAMAPPIGDQLCEQGIELEAHVVGRFQNDADAILRLYFHNVLTQGETKKARQRLFEAIRAAAAQEATP